MLSSENDDFKFLKTAKKHKMHVHYVHHSSMARVTVLSLQTSLSLTRNINVTVASAVLYILRNTSNVTLSIFSILYDLHVLSSCCINGNGQNRILGK